MQNAATRFSTFETCKQNFTALHNKPRFQAAGRRDYWVLQLVYNMSNNYSRYETEYRTPGPKTML